MCVIRVASLNIEQFNNLGSLLLNKPFFWRNLQHVVQLQPWGGQLLLGRPVVALALPLPPGHDEEHEEADDGNEGHPADDGADDQGQLFGRRRLKCPC